MKSTILTALFITIISVVHGQDLDAFKLLGGSTVNEKKYVKYDKLPFYRDGFLKGKLTTDRGNVIDPINLRYDMFANELQYLKDKTVYLVSEPVKEFVLNEEVSGVTVAHKFRRYIIPVSGKPIPAFCEVLYDGGDVKLLRYIKKSESERTNMTSATTLKTFTDYEIDFLQKGKNGELVKLDKNGKNLLPLLSDKEQQVNEYIKSNKIKLSNEDQLVTLLKYYDSLN